MSGSGLALLLSCLLLATTVAGPAGAEPVPVEEDYLLHCSGCHRLDGTGVPGTVPSLHELSQLLSAEGGRAYLASVPGVAQAPLDNARLAALLNWVIRTFSGAAPVPPYTGPEVAELRREPLRDTPTARARLEARLQAQRR